MAFAGFDCGSFPGFATLTAWMGTSPYTWVGYYLPAPCHSANFAPWIGHRQALQDLGWGLAVVYVGRQQGTPCGTAQLSRNQGSADGADASRICLNDGFPAESTIFLDVEHFDGAISGPMSDYLRGWVNEVAVSTPYKVGIYLHHANFADVSAAAAAEFAAIGRPNDKPQYWVTFEAPALGFAAATSAPTDCGLPANIWQGLLDTGPQTYGGIKIAVVDENVADTADPSAP